MTASACTAYCTAWPGACAGRYGTVMASLPGFSAQGAPLRGPVVSEDEKQISFKAPVFIKICNLQLALLKIQEKILHCNSHFVQSSLPLKRKSDISFAEIRSIVNYNTKADQIRSQISLYLFCAHNWGQHSTMDVELNEQFATPSKKRYTWGVSLTPLGIQ